VNTHDSLSTTASHDLSGEARARISIAKNSISTMLPKSFPHPRVSSFTNLFLNVCELLVKLQKMIERGHKQFPYITKQKALLLDYETRGSIARINFMKHSETVAMGCKLCRDNPELKARIIWVPILT
jgi:hypothetical protein